MKNSIGSLAALTVSLAAAPVALEAAPYESDVRAASFSNVSVSLTSPTPIDFDINGDGTADFFVYGNSGTAIRFDPYDPATLSSTSALTFGSTFETTAGTKAANTLIPINTTAYYGFSFITGGETHAAWVQFDVNAINPVVVGGGWQASPALSITVGAIPEPSTAGALAGASALLGALVLRRRRTTL